MKVMRTATGEEQEAPEREGKDPNAAALGKKGGKARARKLTPEQRREIARKGAAKRWRATEKKS